jgi:hypothetical protein
MSFLNPVRLAFAGTFQADVSTVNNDVRHFDNASFQPSYQDLQEGPSLNGWWNPTGSGAFRLLDCQVTGVWYGDGTTTADPAEDPVVGMWIGGSSGRTSGKLVDIDPQWQLASAPWGLEMRLTDGQRDLLGGRYEPAAFRDLWFSRLTGSSQDGAASSTFQSILRDVGWAADAATHSRFLGELQAATATGQLSVRLTTFGYQGDATVPGYTLGTVVGAVGPRLAGEPVSFVGGRRFTPASQSSSWNGITYFSGLVDEASGTLLLDLSNALPITDGQGTPDDIGTLVAGVLRDPATTENTPVSSETFEAVAEVPYRDPGWLQSSGGVLATVMTPEQVALAGEHPLALVTSASFDPGGVGFDAGHGIVAIRESADGLFVCAEPAVHRIDAGGSSSFTIHASRYGTALAGAGIRLDQVGRVPGQGGSGPTNDPSPPSAPIPDIGFPEDRLRLDAGCTTGPAGTAVVTMSTTVDGPGRPRGYIDGQIYLVDYRLPGQSDTARQPFDFVVVHARDAQDPVEHPTWDDVGPIFTQYANLYPIMSKQLIDLADPAEVLRHRHLLRLAFSADIDDPNHMPVTRDLSEPKRRLVLRWLEEGVVGDDQGRPDSAATPAPPATPAGGDDDRDPGSKTRFAAGFQRAMRGARRR